MNAVAVALPASALRAVADEPFVASVRPILRGHRGPEPRDLPLEELRGILSGASVPASAESAFYGASYAQLNQIGVLDLHRMGYTGAGVKVMMLDTGFKKSHEAFKCADTVWEYDYVFGDSVTANQAGDNPTQHTHGTGVWGTLGAYAPGLLIGPAFASTFYLAKTEDVNQEVQAEEQNYVAALEAADLMGVEITSAGLPYWMCDKGMGDTKADLDGDTGVITQAVDIAVGKGIACVNSMGNSGPADTTLGTPADADSVIAVGAVASTGTIASFSSRGPTADGRIKPEVLARGVSTVWAKAAGGFGTASGTSLSAPLIGGLAALLKEAHPTWTGADIRAAIMGTASQAGSPNNSVGFGLARAVPALTFGGAVPTPPRMTLPFVLLCPVNAETLTTVTPKLVWSASAASPGDAAAYTVKLATTADFSAGVVTANAGADTCWTPTPALTPGAQYWWKVEATGNQGYARKSLNTGTFVVSSSVAVEPPVPPVTGLRAPAPNPTRSGAVFAFALPAGESASLEVYAVDGSLVRRYALAASGGLESVAWDGRTGDGRRVSAGLYFVRLRAGGDSWTHKLSVLP